jgi:hypothetical protein
MTPMRAPNHDDARLALELYDLRRESEMRKARHFVGSLMGRSFEDVNAVMQYDHPGNAHFRQATSYWEMASSFVNRGILHPDVFADTCGEALFTYAAFEPHLAKIRVSRPRFLEQTEAAIRSNPAALAKLEDIKRRFAPPAASHTR